MQQFESGFKRLINWNKYQSKATIHRKNQYLDYLIDPSLQGVSRLFLLSFENNAKQTIHTRYFLPTPEIKGCNVIADESSQLKTI